MLIFITICAAVGAWLLVAGPMYQAAIELQEQALDRDSFEAAQAAVPAPTKVSHWWWLLPPVAWAKQRTTQQAYRQAVMDVMGPEQMSQAVNFLNKATGWLMVAGGASLLAVAESWNLTVEFHWEWWAFVIIVVVAPVLCVSYTVGRMQRSSKMVKKAEADSRRRGITPPP